MDDHLSMALSAATLTVLSDQFFYYNMRRKQANVLRLKHQDRAPPKELIWELQYMLNDLKHNVIRHFVIPNDPSIVLLYFHNKDAGVKCMEDRKAQELFAKKRFSNPADNQANKNNMANARTVHVTRLHSNFFFQTLRNKKTFTQCSYDLLKDLQEKVGPQVESLHVLRNPMGEGHLPDRMNVTFKTVSDALNWVKVSTNLHLGVIPKNNKKMHHNTSYDICTICRTRNCRKNGTTCDGRRRCATCLSFDHEFKDCTGSAKCNNCKAPGHSTGSTKCPLNREYLKKKLEAIDNQRRISAVSRGDPIAMGESLNRIQRQVNAWDKPPQISARPTAGAAAGDTAGATAGAPPQLPVGPQPQVVAATDSTTTFSAAGFKMAMMFSAMECVAADYDLRVFKQCLEDFCFENKVEKMNFLKPSRDLLHYLVGEPPSEIISTWKPPGSFARDHLPTPVKGHSVQADTERGPSPPLHSSPKETLLVESDSEGDLVIDEPKEKTPPQRKSNSNNKSSRKPDRHADRDSDSDSSFTNSETLNTLLPSRDSPRSAKSPAAKATTPPPSKGASGFSGDAWNGFWKDNDFLSQKRAAPKKTAPGNNLSQDMFATQVSLSPSRLQLSKSLESIGRSQGSPINLNPQQGPKSPTVTDEFPELNSSNQSAASSASSTDSKSSSASSSNKKISLDKDTVQKLEKLFQKGFTCVTTGLSCKLRTKSEATIRQINTALGKGELKFVNTKGYASTLDIVKAIDGGEFISRAFPLSIQVKLNKNKTNR